MVMRSQLNSGVRFHRLTLRGGLLRPLLAAILGVGILGSCESPRRPAVADSVPPLAVQRTAAVPEFRGRLDASSICFVLAVSPIIWSKGVLSLDTAGDPGHLSSKGDRMRRVRGIAPDSGNVVTGRTHGLWWRRPGTVWVRVGEISSLTLRLTETATNFTGTASVLSDVGGEPAKQGVAVGAKVPCDQLSKVEVNAASARADSLLEAHVARASRPET